MKSKSTCGLEIYIHVIASFVANRLILDYSTLQRCNSDYFYVIHVWKVTFVLGRKLIKMYPLHVRM